MTDWLPRWVALVVRRPILSLALVLLVTVLCAAYTAARFSVDTEMGNLIRQEAPWRDHYEVLKAAFPERHDTALVVASGPSRDAVQQATKTLAHAFSEEDHFGSLFAPLSDPFFERNALLFLSLEQLERLTDRLASAQPVLSSVADGRGLAGLFEIMTQAIERGEVSELNTLLVPITASAEDLVTGGDGRIRWRDRLLSDDDAGTHYSLIILGKNDSTDSMSDGEFMEHTSAVIERAVLPTDVDVRVTGAIALSHEELLAAQQGLQIAGIVSVVLLALILYFGVRSLHIILATGAMLVIGIVWTAAWGLLAVGHFNPLSLIFAVVFFGLGVDFAIHYALRFQEALAEHSAPREALIDAARTVGGAIMLCAMTTAIGFLAFVPTDYQGVSQLGIIAAGGMIIAAFLTLTMMPPLLSMMPHRAVHRGGKSAIAALGNHLLRARKPVLIATALLTLIALVLAPRLEFDHSVLALKNPDAESMRLLRELQDQGVANDYTISVLVDDPARIAALKQELEALDVVDRVETPFDYVPADQEDKRFLLEDLGLLLGDALIQRDNPPDALDGAELSASVDALLQEIAAAKGFGDDLDTQLQRLSLALHSLQDRDDGLTRWNSTFSSSLMAEMDWLRQALQATPITFEDLPASLRARLRSDQGQGQGLWHLSVLPSEDVSSTAALTRYVDAVQQIVPDATGRPVLEKGLGDLVLQAFAQALLLAVAAVTVVLIMALRNLRDVLLVLMPLALAALLTVCVQVVAGLPLNMANILVLPLIFGLGVGNGIHMVQRYRSGQAFDAVLASSTPRAVLLSSLTTIGAFAALALSPHAGTASIGLLLTVAVTLLLLTVIFLLPVFLASFGRPTA